jgi:tripartite ATP-independent transporter DctM subunit
MAWLALLTRLENVVASLALGGVMVLPLSEIVARTVFGGGILGSGTFAQTLTMWVGLLGGAIAARESKLLTLATGEFLPKGAVTTAAHIVAGAAGSAIATIYAMGAVALVRSDRASGDDIAGLVPVWVADLVLPVGFGLIALRLAWRAAHHPLGRGVAALGIVFGLWLSTNLTVLEGGSPWPWIGGVVFAGIVGMPIFALLGGIALFATLADGGRPIALLIKAQSELTTSQGLAAIPLFTLAGFLFAEGRSSERLLRALRAVFGWFPGGTAVAAATLCAFFTLFTGGSGVTILALGGLLLPGLLKEGYRERFSIGMLTASGSLGLLFPLSLPLMLYGIVAQNIRIEDLFIGGLGPGLVMLGLVALLGVREALAAGAARTRFNAREAAAAVWGAKWEFMLPVVILIVIIKGWAVPAECAPVAALYALIVQRFVHRDLASWKDVVRVMSECIALVGGVLVILSVAVGLTHYLINAQVPFLIIDWVTAHIESRWVFLLLLNVFLLLVGSVMDIFSAIVVVVPLIVPLAGEYQIDPVHLGIIFVANLELGFLHPPLGLNLLLASYRFKKPVLEVTWATLPMLGILALGVLLITYVESLTTWLVRFMGS